jgi:hypothetical protein
MITVNLLQISNTSDSITCNVTTKVGETITGLRVWDSTGYNLSSQAIDLSGLLTQASETENLTITATDLQVSFISGLYIFEITSSEDEDNIYTAIVGNFSGYYECLLDKTLKVEIKNCKEFNYGNCPDCEENLFFVNTLLDALNTALILRYYEEACRIVENLKEMCDLCTECGGDYTFEKTYGTSYRTENNLVIKE